MTEEHSKQINTLTVKLEKTQELHQEQVNLCINTKQQLELANQKIVDQRVHLEKTTKELTINIQHSHPLPRPSPTTCRPLGHR